MGEQTSITWTDHTFNPVRGCVEVSPGCDHCYAAAMSKRNPATLGTWGPDGTRIIASEAMWRAPVTWNVQAQLTRRYKGERLTLFSTNVDSVLPRHIDDSICARGDSEREVYLDRAEWEALPVIRPRVFCASLADVFEDWNGPMSLPCGKGKIARAYKCVDGKFGWGAADDTPEDEFAAYQDVRDRLFALIEATPNLDWQLLTKRPENVLRMVPALWQKKFPPNVWMGTTVEDQQRADERIPELLNISARVRFLSCEPLLEEIDLCFGWQHEEHGFTIDWLITGGESGPGHRQMALPWLESLAEQCTAAGVPLFVKQDSGPLPGRQGRIPDALWALKEFPEVESEVPAA